jgi:8-oxo-dGTP pyrophosphatase MutT (NUDIX family)
MNTDIHALIHQFLQEQAVIPLIPPEGADVSDNSISELHHQKAGMLPFIREEGEFYFYLMKPTAARPGMAPPKWQLCKGTRMYKSNASGKWKDMRPGEHPDNAEIEMLAATALREGHEELGLLPQSISKLFDVGTYRFSSAQTGQDKHMWMFAAEVPERDVFLPASHVAATTADRRWLSIDEFKVVGRDDHLYILDSIQSKLTSVY